MSTWTPDFLANRMLWVFHKRGGEGLQTKSFSQISPTCAAAILAVVDLERDEIPVLASWRSANDWVALTTNRIVCMKDQARGELDLARMVDASATEGEATDDPDLGKFGLRYLTLKAEDGRTLRIEVEAGLPFLGVWNVLKWMAYRAREK